jgi:hypothetical protein
MTCSPQSLETMYETLIVLGLLIALVVAGWMTILLSWQTIVVGGAACALLGLAVGLPTSLYYHLRLHRALHPRGLLPARWWWSPIQYHALLFEGERTGILLWFYAGAFSFGLIVLGCALTGLGLWVAK